jgi:hypothetical protein
VQQCFAGVRGSGVTGVQQPDGRARGDHVADGDERVEGLVRGAQAAVPDGNDAAPGQEAGVEDAAGPRGADERAGSGGEVDAAVPGAPGGERGQERAAHGQRCGERRDPARRRSRGGEREGAEREGAERKEGSERRADPGDDDATGDAGDAV